MYIYDDRPPIRSSEDGEVREHQTAEELKRHLDNFFSGTDFSDIFTPEELLGPNTNADTLSYNDAAALAAIGAKLVDLYCEDRAETFDDL